jgi:Uma2 family endonuclease
MSLPDELWAYIANADESGVRLEMVMGTPYWEAMPGARHQKAVRRIERSIEKASAEGGCSCETYQDLYIQFPDGSFKRPDLSVFCEELADTDGATLQIPRAVIEVVSKGYEAKDLQIGPPFYLSQGIKDVVVFNPATDAVMHVRSDGTQHLSSPALIELECGCRVVV